MLMRFWEADAVPAILLLCLVACTEVPPTTPSATMSKPASIRFTLDSETYTIPVELDSNRVDLSGDREYRVLHRDGSSVVLLDSYASRPQGMSRCQAGTERYLRVVDIRTRSERYSKLVESCLASVVPGDPPFTPEMLGGRVNLVSEPSVSLSFAPDGSVSAR